MDQNSILERELLHLLKKNQVIYENTPRTNKEKEKL